VGQPVAFFEVVSPDLERAQAFYRELFDWQIAADPAMGGYGLVDTGTGEHAIGGDSGRFAIFIDPDGNRA
jgi:predicted enzyme related to lactoylglutathione lyase